MLSTDEFLRSIPDEPVSGVIEINRIVRKAWLVCGNPNVHIWVPQEHIIVLEAFALLKEITESRIVVYRPPSFTVGVDKDADCKNVSNYLADIVSEFEKKAQIKIVDVHQQRFKLGLGGTFAYEFSQGDFG